MPCPAALPKKTPVSFAVRILLLQLFAENRINFFVDPADNIYCDVTSGSAGTCKKYSGLGDECTISSNCRPETDDYIWSAACINGTCRVSGIYYPGESCAQSNADSQGGCLFSDCENGKCDSIAAVTFFGNDCMNIL